MVLRPASLAVPALESAFFQSLGRVCRLETSPPISAQDSPGPVARLSWMRYHTLDDAADAIALELRREGTLDTSAVLIPDLPEVRRSFRRAATQAGLALADPRDPTWPKRAEGIKLALQPLEVVARRFDRSDVLSFFGRRGGAEIPLNPIVLKTMMEQAVGPGLSTYSHPKLAPLRAKLEELNALFGGRKSASELKEIHLQFLKTDSRTQENLYPRILVFMEKLWD